VPPAQAQGRGQHQPAERISALMRSARTGRSNRFAGELFDAGALGVVRRDRRRSPTFPRRVIRAPAQASPARLLAPDSDAGLPYDAERTSVEEFARKPVTRRSLALRIKALILSAGLMLPRPLRLRRRHMVRLSCTPTTSVAS